MDKRGSIISFAFLLGLSACGADLAGTTSAVADRETTTVVTDEEPTTMVTEVRAPEKMEVSTTFAPPDKEPDSSNTTEIRTIEDVGTPESEQPPVEDDAWQSHELAALALTPEHLGDSWEIERAEAFDPTPGGSSDPMCGVEAPPVLSGFGLELRRGDDVPGLSQLVMGGSSAEAQLWIDSIGALTGCAGESPNEPDIAVPVAITVDGADASVSLSLSYSGAEDRPLTTYAAARFGGVVVILLTDIAAEEGEVASTDWMAQQLAWSGAQIDN